MCREPKPPWRSVPAGVRVRAEAMLGAEVRRAVRLWGGYAPSPLFRLYLADGRRAVFKGVGPIAHVNDLMRRIERCAALAGARAADARTWLRTHLVQLARVSDSLAAAPPPHALLHFDTRSDNLRLQHGTDLRLFDWNFASLGPPEIDAAAFAQTITVEGGPPPEAVMAEYRGRLREPVMDAAVAAVAGYFAVRAALPDIPGLPRLRAFQRAQLQVSLAWCARRLALAPPDWLEAIDA